MPGLMDFIIFKVYNRDVDVDLYGGQYRQEEAAASSLRSIL